MESFLILLPYFTFHLFLLFTHFTSYTFSLCNHHDSSALLQFKNSFTVNTSSKPYKVDVFDYYYYSNLDDHSCSSFSFKTESWKTSADCCDWDGVTCNNVSGNVIGLDLSCNNLKGELHPNSSIFQLKHLQQLNLAFNDFSDSSIHVGIGDLVNLKHLNLSYCHLSGNIPSTISHLSKLVSLDLSSYLGVDWALKLNSLTWKKLIHNATNLRELYLNYVNISSIREISLSMLKNLSTSLVSLSLVSTNLLGNLSNDIFSLPNLQILDLSYNTHLRGQLPKSNWSSPLRYLDLSSSAFSGEIPYSIGQLKYLTHLDFSDSNLDGMVPLSLWNLSQLTYLSLSHNKLSSDISNVIGNLNKLEHLTLSSNSLTGQVPSSLFQLPHLYSLDLSNNTLVGPIPIDITNRSKLENVDLSDNMLNGTIPQWCYYLPSLLMMYLNNNNLTGFIDEFSTYSLQGLDLSNNNLHGDFPNSIFELQNLTRLDLSSTNLSGVVDFNQFSKFQKLEFLILSHNSFLSINIDSKVVSISSPYLLQLDLSYSNINSFPKLLAQLPNLFSLDLSNNNFTGDISSAFCNASNLEVLNLAHNNLTGMIPQCLGKLPYLSVLDLQMNNLHGSMPKNFSKGNQFETINLNGNQLEGPLPHSLAHCKILEVLDLGDNMIEDVFPHWLGILPKLQVLRLKSNKFYGTITCSNTKHTFPKLRIFDVSFNNFSGPLPTSCIKNFQEMMKENDNQTGSQYMDMDTNHGYYYKESVVVIMKGFFRDLTRILTALKIIDLSNNMFEGEIPQLIGELNSLKGLNLSNNEITGTIPHSLSSLTNLEWLDISRNQLTGKIPMALTKLHFLSDLNLSHNQLEGMIPKGQQFDTFGIDSYEGNGMLCGFPLSKSCTNDEDRLPHSTSEDEEESGFGWKAVAIGYACGAISGLVLGHNVFFFGKPEWLARLVEHIFTMRLRRTNNRAGANRRRIN